MKEYWDIVFEILAFGSYIRQILEGRKYSKYIGQTIGVALRS